MADTLEFSDVAFPKYRFSDALLAELRELIPSLIEEEGDTLFIKHLYIERRMVPLNIYLDHASTEEKERIIDDYGMAIRQLAAANIFASDLLFKNFGVTRYGRVVFYDYDEIDYLTAFNFRYMPKPRNDEEELSNEIWYTIEPNDVFPEEFEKFVLVNRDLRASFRSRHADLLDAGLWQEVQKRLAAGHIEDVFPYPEELRFRNRFPERIGAD
jgi:isocitrate dehydrogenase kinase/phosphatase